MRRYHFLVLILAFPLIAQTTLVKTGRILDVAAGRYVTDQGVLIQNGYIQQVGAYEFVRAAASSDATLIDLGNLTILPGPRILASGRKIVPEGGQAIPVQAGVLESILKQEFLTASTADDERQR